MGSGRAIKMGLNTTPWCNCNSTTVLLAGFIFLLISTISTADPTSSMLGPQSYFNSADEASFPKSEIVLDMVVLSDAVYYLRNKVTSCKDPQATNRTLISSTRQEILSNLISDGSTEADQIRLAYFRRLHDNNQDSQNIFDILLPEGTTCLHYSHDYDLGTQALIVRSSRHNYISTVYAGTDDFTTALMDGKVLMSRFGPSNITSQDIAAESSFSDWKELFQQVPEEAHVHHGFNSAVFDSKYFLEVFECIKSARLGGSCDASDTQQSLSTSSEPYQLYTTGHSLGAASSVLLGATLHLTFPSDHIQSINFGCPKLGNVELSYWIDSLQPSQNDHDGSLEVFRFVNKLDLVPRLPDLIFFQHVGHTLQMSPGGKIHAYYNHWGDEDLGFAGVPFGWGAEPYVLFPLAIHEHDHKLYVQFLQDYAPKPSSSLIEGESLYFVTEFEHIDEDERTETVSPTVTE